MAPSPPKKVLLITRNLPPLVGGMERLNWHMADELSRCADVQIVGPTGSRTLAPNSVSVHEVALRPLSRFLLEAKIQAIKLACNWQPDVVLAGSGLTALPALLAAKACRGRSAAYVHGLDLAIQHPLYRALWLPALRRMSCILANSTATALLAQSNGISSNRIRIVHPGVEPPIELADIRAVDEFRKQNGLSGAPVLLSVGRLTERKGLREFVAHVLPRIAEVHPKVVLLVVGDPPADALHARPQTPDSIRAVAQQNGVAHCVRFLGTIIDYRKLGLIYRAANVHVFPVQALPNDPEGFGMVAIEAAAHGLPTVAYATGGIVDAVKRGESGSLVEVGNYVAFANEVLRILEKPLDKGRLYAHAERFAWSQFGRNVLSQLALL